LQPYRLLRSLRGGVGVTQIAALQAAEVASRGVGVTQIAALQAAEVASRGVGVTQIAALQAAGAQKNPPALRQRDLDLLF